MLVYPEQRYSPGDGLKFIFYNGPEKDICRIDDTLEHSGKPGWWRTLNTPEWAEPFREAWSDVITKKIILKLSKTACEGKRTNGFAIQKAVGHSYSTIFNTLKKMEANGLISKELVYEDSKQYLIQPHVLAFPDTEEGHDSALKIHCKETGIALTKTYTEIKTSVLEMAKGKNGVSPVDLCLSTGLPEDVVLWTVFRSEEKGELETPDIYKTTNRGLDWLKKHKKK